MGTVLAGAPSIKIDGEWRPQGKGPHDDVEVRVAYSLRHGETLCRFLSGVELTQLTFFKKPEGWLLMLKGTRGKKKLVAFLMAFTFADALVMAATTMDTGKVPWGPDNPPPKG